jgi:glycosyltransferase involved in cell wall biosynthesis
MKKALILCTTCNIGGTERAVLNLARGLLGKGIDVRVVCPEAPNSPETMAWFKREGVNATTSDLLRPPKCEEYTPRQMGRLTKLVRESGADIVNMHYGGNHISFKDVIAMRMAVGKRCVVTVHHAVPISDTHKRRMNRISGPLAHAVIVTTDLMRQLLIDTGVPARKIHVVPLGLPIPANPPTKTEARSRLGLPAGAFVVSALGRLVAYKGIGDLIESLSRLPDPQSSSRLVVAGDGPERAALEAQAADRLKERALFLGYVEDTSDLYAASDIFVLPSQEEGFGLVYLEAAFHGVPSIGYNVGGVPYAIEDGKTGLLVPLCDLDALSKAIQRLRDDEVLRKSLGDNAKTRALERFTESASAERYLQVYYP